MTATDLKAALERRLSPRVEDLVASFELPGVAVGVVKSGELAYARGFGVRDLETGQAVTPTTLFHLASVSKPFVATAALKLVEEGRLSLDARVTDLLPDFRFEDVTVRQLLNHTSGLGDPLDYRWHAPEDDDEALARLVRTLSDDELTGVPGEKFSYSNTGFEVLGHVLATVSGTSFEAFLKASVLAPLGMRASTFSLRDVDASLAAAPHFGAPSRVLRGTYPYHRAHAPSSSLHSSVEELALFAAERSRAGLSGAERVESGGTGWYEAALFGWFAGTYAGRAVVHHDGGDPGFESNLVLVPSEDAAVIVLTNANTAPVGHITAAALNVVLGQDLPEAPKPPIVLPLARTLAREGPGAAERAYHDLVTQSPDRFDARPSQFLYATWGAVEMHRPDLVVDLLRLWTAVQPNEADAHAVLGWAHDVGGEVASARIAYERALELDPDNEIAATQLKGLRS